MSFTKWTDYRRELPDGQSYSERTTGSGHITLSALVQADGRLRAFPPRAAERAYPLFVIFNATAGGKWTELNEGVYPSKGWDYSREMHHGRAKLAQIFFERYGEIRTKQNEKARPQVL